MTDDARIAVVQERLGALDAKVTAAHARIDRTEDLIREDLKEIKTEFVAMSQELKDVVGYMNRSKGWAAAATLAAGLFGGLVAAAISHALGVN